MAGRTAENLDILTSLLVSNNNRDREVAEKEGEENARGANRKPAFKPSPKHDVPENHTNAGEPDRSDSQEADDSV
ncbi:unnamed protein product [Sphenostylis stenocarpa]|uniref:Uncharacterized protein n=1 Tax=Sphenostylis stenocarpa TaxID=92480 RepID=A0AA86T0P0_9FABA|nr:unnamed protein product [Sphenostylis stenocarpa]